MRIKLMAAAMMLLVGVCGSYASGFKGEKIVCIADGVTRGIDSGIGRGERWVDLLAKQTGAKIIYATRPELTTRDMGFMKEVLRNNRDASRFVIFVGVNDFAGIGDIDSATAASTAARVARLAQQIRKDSPLAQVWIVAPHRVSSFKLTPYWKGKAFGGHTEVMGDLLASSLQVAAKATGAHYISLLDEVSPEMLLDGVEPNKEGHQQIANIIAAGMEPGAVQNAKVIYATQKKVVPPAAGRPYFDRDGARAIANSVASDLQALQGPKDGSNRNEVTAASLPVRKSAHGGDVIEYVADNQASELVSEEGMIAARSAVDGVLEVVDNEMDWQEVSGVEAVYDGLVRPELAQQILVQYELPPVEGEKAYIMAIVTPEGNNHVLGEAVDWNRIEGPSVSLAPAQSIPVKTAPVEKPVRVPQEKREVDPAEPVEVIVRLPELAEVDHGQRNAAGDTVIPGIPALYDENRDAGLGYTGETAQAGATLAVPGYAVYVHTRAQ